MTHPYSPDGATTLHSARRTLRIEAEALNALQTRLDGRFTQVVTLMLNCDGRVVVSGIGKTGHIARKIAATFASTGTPAFFLHAGEAMHGDLGMLTARDLLIAISYSGTGEELLAILPVARRMGTPIVSLTGNPDSELARLSDVHLDVSVDREACPLNLAPTASTTAALALGDALAVACLQARGFGSEDFARSHPAGALGRKLLTHVSDVMRTGAALPVVPELSPIEGILETMSAKRMGMAIAMGQDGKPAGIFTDGDLRRLITSHGDVRGLMLADFMSRSPRSIAPQALATEAARRMDELRVSQILVLNENGALLGALHMHDLMAAKVI